jgi:hypothetical protein
MKDLSEEQYPVCLGERATFMSPFSIDKTLEHPYVDSPPSTHGHLKPTRVQFPVFAAAAVPYYWMLKKMQQRRLNYLTWVTMMQGNQN